MVKKRNKMRAKRNRWIWCCLWAFCPLGGLQAQFCTGDDEGGARWGLEYTGGVMVKPFLQENPQQVSTGRGQWQSVRGEYFLPKKWSIQAGYYRTTLDYGHTNRTMEGISIGAKRYFVPNDCLVQPYVGAAWQFNWSGRREEYTSGWESVGQSVVVRQTAVNPRVAFVPSVGVDVYLFSSVALVVRYDLGIGIDSRTRIEATTNDGTTFRIKDKGLYHGLSLGIRLTFPMHFSERDLQSVGGLGGLLFDLWDESLDRKLQEQILYR